VVRRVSGYKKIRYYSHENIGYGPVNLPDQELHTTALWWQLPQQELEAAFASRQDALDGFLGAAYALHLVATLAVMADGHDLQKAVGSGDGAWCSRSDSRGRSQLRGPDGSLSDPADSTRFVPTVFLYDNFPGGIGMSEPLFNQHGHLIHAATDLIQGCDCEAGCPACVGPSLAMPDGVNESVRELALRVLALLGGA
jgi:DEAD/DEAH box helicase domain-containing protein